MSEISELITEIKTNHFHVVNHDHILIENFSIEHRKVAPTDLTLFMKEFSQVRLFPNSERDVRFTFNCYAGFHPVALDVIGRHVNDPLVESWFTICDVCDNNYVAADLTATKGTECEMIDCFHETFLEKGYRKIISKSFTEFLKSAMLSNNNLFWLENNAPEYGYK